MLIGVSMESRMREVRYERGKSLMRVHRDTGVPYTTLRRWESGKLPTAPVEKVVLVARSLGCRVEDLVSE